MITRKKINLSNFKIVYQYIKSDFIKKKKSYIIGVISVFLIVLFICVLMNAIEMSPVIFLRLCEDQSGETDIILLPAPVQDELSSEIDKIEHNPK